MTPLQKRFRNVMQILGEPVTIGTNPTSSMIAPISTGNALVYLNQGDLNGISARPIYGAYVPHDASVAENDTFVWGALSLTVYKVLNLNSRQQTLAKLLVIA